MIRDHEVVVDSLGYMQAPQIVGSFLRFLQNHTHGVGAIVASDVKEITNLVCFQYAEDLFAVRTIRLITCGTKRCRWCLCHHLEVMCSLLSKVYEILVYDA